MTYLTIPISLLDHLNVVSDCILVSGKLSLHILFFFIIFLVFSGIIKNKFLNYE